MSDNAWRVLMPGQRTNRQAVTESERESSAVMQLRRSFMGEPVNGSVERVVQARRQQSAWKRKRGQALTPRRLSGGMLGMSVQ